MTGEGHARVCVLYGKYQGTTGTILQVSKGAGYWYLVQIDGYGVPQWIHNLHVKRVDS